MIDAGRLTKIIRSRWYIIVLAIVMPLISNLPKNISGGTAVTNPSSAQLLSYQNKADGYTFSYPASWDKREEAPQTSVFFLTSAHASEIPASLIVLKIKLDDPAMSLDAFSDGTLRQLKQDFPDLTVITTEKTQWAGQKGYRIVFNSTSPNKNLVKTVQVWTIHGKNVYIMGFGGSPESYEKYQTAGEKVMASFRFL